MYLNIALVSLSVTSMMCIHIFIKLKLGFCSTLGDQVRSKLKKIEYLLAIVNLSMPLRK